MMEKRTYSEKEIIERFLQEEENSFNELFHLFYRRFCFCAAKITGDKDIAEDIVQDIFFNLLKLNLSDFKQSAALKAYLYNSVRNRSLNHLRNQQVKLKNSAHLKPAENEDESGLCDQIQAEVLTEIFKAVNELPEKCRQVFTMSYLEDCSDKDIAETLGITINTIKTQKRRAKAYLRLRLGHLFILAQLLFIKL